MRWTRALPSPGHYSKKDIPEPFLVWSMTRNRYEMYDAYSIRANLKQIGYEFDRSLKCWFTNSIKKANSMKKYWTESAKKRTYM